MLHVYNYELFYFNSMKFDPTVACLAMTFLKVIFIFSKRKLSLLFSVKHEQ
jgi:hypothetical protein